MIVIEELHLRVTSYTNGMLKLTNINKPAMNKVVGMYHSPTGEFPTAMAAITGQTKTGKIFAKLIVGYSNASIRVMTVYLKSNGTPVKNDHSIKIKLSDENCPINAITIIDNKSIVTALANNKMLFINFEPNLMQCSSSGNININHGIKPTIPCGEGSVATAILLIDSIRYVYVLTDSRNLNLYINKNGTCTDGQLISKDVTRISTPTLRSNSLVFAKADGIYVTNPQSSSTLKISIPDNTIRSNDIIAMTSTVSSLYVLDDKLFIPIPFSSHASSASAAASAAAPAASSGGGVALPSSDPIPPSSSSTPTPYSPIPPPPTGPLIDLSPDAFAAASIVSGEPPSGDGFGFPVFGPGLATVVSSERVPPLPYNAVPFRPHANTASSSSSSAPGAHSRLHSRTGPPSAAVAPPVADPYGGLPVAPAANISARIVETSTGKILTKVGRIPDTESGHSGATLEEYRDDRGNPVFAKKFNLGVAAQLEEYQTEKLQAACLPSASASLEETVRGVATVYGHAQLQRRKNGTEQTGDQNKRGVVFSQYLTQRDGATLLNFLNTSTIEVKCQCLLSLFLDLVAGLQTLHANHSICHLDIKPGNFVLEYKIGTSRGPYKIADLENNTLKAKIIDFGQAQQHKNFLCTDWAMKKCSDSYYLSPQRVNAVRNIFIYNDSPIIGDQHVGNLPGDIVANMSEKEPTKNTSLKFNGRAEDAWALGVTFLELLLGVNPFRTQIIDMFRQGGFNQAFPFLVSNANNSFYQEVIGNINHLTPLQPTTTKHPLINMVMSLVDVDANKRFLALNKIYHDQIAQRPGAAAAAAAAGPRPGERSRTSFDDTDWDWRDNPALF